MTLGQLLSVTSPPVVVPDWQRNYSWTTVEVETFWEDICRFDRNYPDTNIEGEEYFLGAVVIVDTSNSHLLLDGQQRVATAAILISVIRDHLIKYNSDAATRVSTRYLTDFDDALEDYTYKVTLNRFDRDYFKRLILETRNKSWTEPDAQYESHTLIRRARVYFEKKFEEYFNNSDVPKTAHQWALRILKVVTNHISVVGVISKDEDNASSVFETLNDRGIGLSTTDLLRNLILRRAVEAQMNEILDLWGEILEIESDTKLQDFFRHFWISREGDVKARSLYRDVKSTIIERDIESLEFSREMQASAQVYQDILNGTYNESEDTSNLLQEVVSLGAKVLYPPILSLLETKSDPKVINIYIRSLICAYVRHSLICKRENSLLENIMFSTAKSVRHNERTDEELLAELRDFSPNDDAFRSAFATVSVNRRGSSRYLLEKIEYSKRNTEELKIAQPSKVHVEHIYPQTPPAENRLAQHSLVINRLGNLTLLSARLNKSIKNGTYSDKKPSFEQSEIFLTKEIPEKYDNWGQETIDARQLELADLAITIWQFD